MNQNQIHLIAKFRWVWGFLGEDLGVFLLVCSVLGVFKKLSQTQSVPQLELPLDQYMQQT